MRLSSDGLAINTIARAHGDGVAETAATWPGGDDGHAGAGVAGGDTQECTAQPRVPMRSAFAFEKWKDGRNERKESRKPIQYGITAALALWIAWALRRTKLLWVGPALSLPLVMCLTDLTCYYYSMFIVAAPLMKLRPGIAPALLVTSGASHILLRTFYYIDDKYTAMSYLFYAMGLLLLYACSRPFSMERLKAWWEGKPEPKPQPEPQPRATTEEPSAPPDVVAQPPAA
jgi:hypothetical protein